MRTAVTPPVGRGLAPVLLSLIRALRKRGRKKGAGGMECLFLSGGAILLSEPLQLPAVGGGSWWRQHTQDGTLVGTADLGMAAFVSEIGTRRLSDLRAELK